MKNWKDSSFLVDADLVLPPLNSDKKCSVFCMLESRLCFTVNEILEGLPHMALSCLPHRSLHDMFLPL